MILYRILTYRILYLIQIKQCKLASMNESQVAYGSRNLCGSGFLHLLFAGLSFSSNLQRIEFFICLKTTLRYQIHHIEKLPSLQGTAEARLSHEMIAECFKHRWSYTLWSTSTIKWWAFATKQAQVSANIPNRMFTAISSISNLGSK